VPAGRRSSNRDAVSVASRSSPRHLLADATQGESQLNADTNEERKEKMLVLLSRQ
jgi:hypothetical protein